jgi:hypothetical protein
MARSAPRYDPRVQDAIQVLDDRRESIAEVCRRVNAVLDELNVTRVSYVHLRRLIVDHRDDEDFRRDRREALRKIAADAAGDFMAGPRPRPLLLRAAHRGRGALSELVALSHKLLRRWSRACGCVLGEALATRWL